MATTMDFWNSRVERAPLEELREMQGRKLRQLVDMVYRHSRFYRKRFTLFPGTPF